MYLFTTHFRKCVSVPHLSPDDNQWPCGAPILGLNPKQTSLLLLLLASPVMPYNSAHHCVVEVENFLLLMGGEDQWNPNGKANNQSRDTECSTHTLAWRNANANQSQHTECLMHSFAFDRVHSLTLDKNGCHLTHTNV